MFCLLVLLSAGWEFLLTSQDFSSIVDIAGKGRAAAILNFAL